MKIDIEVHGLRLYVDLSATKPAPAAPLAADTATEQAPTHIGTPMVVHAGPLGYYATRAGKDRLP